MIEEIKELFQSFIAPQLEGIRGDIRALDTKIGAVEMSLSSKIGAVETSLNSRIEALDAKIGALDTKIGAFR